MTKRKSEKQVPLLEIECPACGEIIKAEGFCEWTGCPSCNETRYRIIDEWEQNECENE